MMIFETVHVLAVFHFILLFLPANNCQRKPKGRDKMQLPPTYEIYQKDVLPSDVQVTTFLHKGEKKLFFYNSLRTGGALSATIVPCRGPIQWTVEFLPHHNLTSQPLGTFHTEDMDTYPLPADAEQGTYTFTFVALEGNSFLHVYLSTEPGGPQTLQSAKFQEIKLLKRQKRRRLTVKWNPSSVDPQGTDYCLVMSKEIPYRSLCAAQFHSLPTPNVPHTTTSKTKEIEGNNTTVSAAATAGDRNQSGDPFITCVGRKTHYTVSDLNQGQNYSFFVFAINRQSNFTYLYGSASTVFDKKTNPATLKDGVMRNVNLKELDGKAVFKFKVGKRSSSKSLDLYVVPCGGVVDVEVATKDKKVAKLMRRIEGFGKVSIPNPKGMERYYIKIFAMNKEELKKTAGVEIYVTTKPSLRIPLPDMPQEAQIHEYLSLRTCSSITVGWLVAPLQRGITLEYCLVVREGTLMDDDYYRLPPNQCGLENRLRKSVDFVVKLCQDVNFDSLKTPLLSSKERGAGVMTRKISQLKPGRNYVILVTVKKPKGKTLSYDLLQAQTKASCKQG